MKHHNTLYLAHAGFEEQLREIFNNYKNMFKLAKEFIAKNTKETKC
jgi:hypothetical protein